MRIFISLIAQSLCDPLYGNPLGVCITVETRWDEKAGLRRDAVRSQVIDVLEAQEIKETGK